MNKSIILLFAAGTMVLSGCLKKDPKSEKEKLSYAIGHQIGSKLKAQKVDVDVKMLAAAMQDAVDGKKSKLTPKEVQEAMRKEQEKKMGERKKESEDNLKKGSEFLAKNKTAEGVKVTDSGLQYKVITEGKGAKPKANNKVSVHYKGTLIDGTEFDSSIKRDKPAEFQVGGVIKGWTEALQLMKKGAKWKLFIPADLAYGKVGRPSIPPNSVLIFEVELLDILKDKK